MVWVRIVLCLLVGFGELSAEGTPHQRVKIGFLVKQPEETWFQKEWRFAEQAGREHGFDVVKIGATDGEKVLSAIDSLGAQGAQGFVICAPDVRLGPSILARARVYNMKVIAVDDQLLGLDAKPIRSVPYLGISAREIGIAAASVAWAELGTRRWPLNQTGVIAITFNELETARARLAGATSFLDAVGFPVSHIFDGPQKTTDVEGGFNAANIVITKHPDIANWLVFGLNDESVLGGVQALEGRGFRGTSVIGVGINGMAVAVSELRKKAATGFFASILLDSRRHGYDTAVMLAEWITSEKVPPLDIRTQGTVITRENYVSVLRSRGLGDLVP